MASRSACEVIVARARLEMVVTGSACEMISTGATIDQVMTLVTRKPVVTLAAVDKDRYGDRRVNGQRIVIAAADGANAATQIWRDIRRAEGHRRAPVSTQVV